MTKTFALKSAPPCLTSIGDDQCTGCAACANGCPHSAIEIKLNQEGFYRPFLRAERCNECMVCLHHCPVIAITNPDASFIQNSKTPEVFAAWSTSEEVHLSSSSGGIFSELARYILDHGGAVCGCEWGEHWIPRHVIIKDWNDISKLRGSKYIPSFIGEQLYKEIIGLAKSGTTVLFCGTPCQVAGLDRIAPPAARSNIILVELVCHGVPSLTSFWSYIDWKFGGIGRLTYYSFRNKELCCQTICAFTDSGNKYLTECYRDHWFSSAMVYHLLLQRSCYSCLFCSIPRHGDLTLGDFWGIPEQWHNPHGDSVILTNTQKGAEVFNQLIKKKLIRVIQSDYATASQKSPRLRGAFYHVPVLRSLALRMIANRGGFALFYHMCYRPLHFGNRVFSAVQRRLPLLSRLFSRK